MRVPSRVTVSVGAVVLLFVADVTTQQRASADVLLRKALDAAVVDGDLRGAITQYQTIVDTFPTDRTVVATALLHMGEAYEKLGVPEAQSVYERIVHDYADQRQVMEQAQSRLRATRSNGGQGDADTLRTELLVVEATGSPQGSVSPDGRLVTYVDWQNGGSGNLAVRDLQGGESRHLTHTADNGSGAENGPGQLGGNYADISRISPDGSQVAYTWQGSSPVGETSELRVLSLHDDDAQPRMVWRPADGSYAGVQDWFPGGDRVVAVTALDGFSQIVTVSIPDGQVQQIRSIEWAHGPNLPQVRVSPDGRYLAYSRAAARDVPEKDVVIVAVDGSSESVIVQHAADDELVDWSAGGTHLLFNSDRSGQPGLWAQRVEGGQPVGEPRLLVSNLDVGTGMGMTRNGSLHYAVRVTRRRMKIAELDLATGALLGLPVDATDRFIGSNNGPQFSPDGETLFYISQRRGWSDTVGVLQSLGTGEILDLHLDLEYWRGGHWRPDGSLVVSGLERSGRFGWFEVDVATEELKLLAARPDIPDMARSLLMPNGTDIVYTRMGDGGGTRLHRHRLDDGRAELLTDAFVVHERGAQFSLSPDGHWIANHSALEIRLHPVEGGDYTVVATTDERHEFGRWTTWTPDATALLVLKEDPEAGENVRRLWAIPLDGSEPRPTELAYEPANAGAVPLRIHPDGRRVVYTAGPYFHQYWALHNLGLD